MLSPSIRSKDLLLKRALYEDSDVAAFWVVDLEVPLVRGWTLVGGRYAEEQVALGDEVFVSRTPFDVRVVPSTLVDR